MTMKSDALRRKERWDAKRAYAGGDIDEAGLKRRLDAAEADDRVYAMTLLWEPEAVFDSGYAWYRGQQWERDGDYFVR